MSTPHRRWLPMALALACTLGLPLAGAPVLAQDWPNKPVRVIVPFPPGGGTDTVARPLTAKLTQLTGQQFNIDNRGGAGGTIGAAMAAKAPADGYSVLLAPVHLAVAVSAYKSLPYELEKDLVPVTTVAVFPDVLVAATRVPAKTLPELIAYAKANAGKINCGSAGNGTTRHLSCEMFNSAAGIKTLAVPYKGAAPMGTDLMGGEIMVGLDSLGAGVNTLLASNKVTLLATTGSRRAPAFANVPTVAETLPGFLARGTTGVLTTLGTPPDVIDKLFAALAAVANRNDVKEKFLSLSHIPSAAPPAEYGRSIADEIEKWGRVMQESGVVIE